jgi:UDP-N-acetylmuramoyl-L-alanyl-D-glutamate--2,6-diaminopimelate ligase
MRLDELLRGIDLTRPADHDLAAVEIHGIRHDSRRVEPGDLFVVWRGTRHDGRSFAADAVARGARAVLADDGPPPGSDFGGVPWLVAREPRRLLGPLAARLHGHPERQLALLGVTGTNGKSTTIALLAAIAEASGRPCGLVGTLGYRFREQTFPGDRTTPEGSDLFHALAAMRDAGAQAVAMEVSSHALDQGRVEGARFALGVFTNLTRDHFDQHGGFEAYYAAKRRLFDLLAEPGAAAVNLGDPYGRRLAGELRPALGERLVTFGRDPADRPAVAPHAITLDARGIRGTLSTPRGPLAIESPLLGSYNLDNVLAAVAGAEALGWPREAISAGLAAVSPLPGRLEPVVCGQPYPVLIDYAHTDAALAAALASARAFTGKKVAVVFGCGGNRDPGKRELMGRVAGELADLPIVTSDNPRDEDPLAIIAAVEVGLKASGNPSYRILPDRREAIRRAVAVCDANWVLVVAGKGHETEQIIGNRRIPFSDREELVRALEERYGHAIPR